jgi:hypothetical protein
MITWYTARDSNRHFLVTTSFELALFAQSAIEPIESLEKAFKALETPPNPSCSNDRG